MPLFYGKFRKYRAWHIFSGTPEELRQAQSGLSHKSPLCGAYVNGGAGRQVHPKIAEVNLDGRGIGKLVCETCLKRYKRMVNLAEADDAFDDDKRTTIVSPKTGQPFRRGDLKK